MRYKVEIHSEYLCNYARENFSPFRHVPFGRVKTYKWMDLSIPLHTAASQAEIWTFRDIFIEFLDKPTLCSTIYFCPNKEGCMKIALFKTRGIHQMLFLQ